MKKHVKFSLAMANSDENRGPMKLVKKMSFEIFIYFRSMKKLKPKRGFNFIHLKKIEIARKNTIATTEPPEIDR